MSTEMSDHVKKKRYRLRLNVLPIEVEAYNLAELELKVFEEETDGDEADESWVVRAMDSAESEDMIEEIGEDGEVLFTYPPQNSSIWAVEQMELYREHADEVKEDQQRHE